MSSISCGIVGLPNVGKSTLFNALLKKQQALAANYPFATIEPNVGVVAVPDQRLQKLAEVVAKEENPSASSGPGGMSSLPPLKPAMVEFLDIAGLVKGASEGAGLGNKFLSHIREVSVIAHVIRAFSDPDVVSEGSVDPQSDYKTVQTELILADLQTVEKQKDSKVVKTDPVKKSAVEKLFKALNQGISAKDVALTDEEREATRDLFLLSNKQEVIVLNVDENSLSQSDEIIKKYSEILSSVIPGLTGDLDSRFPLQGKRGNDIKDRFVVISAKVESELAALSDEEQKQYLQELGLSESGLERLIRKAYEMLGLVSFLTAGEKEVRAWTIQRGANAQRAAGEIHTDFEKKFIKAEVISFDDYITTGGRKKAREVGKARLEGKDYTVHDGDVIEFKIGT